MKPEQLMRTPVTELQTEADVFPSSETVAKVIGYFTGSKLIEAFVDDGDGATSIVSIRDLLNVSSLGTKLSAIMHQVPRLGPNNNVSDAATAMREFRTKSMPIYDGKKIAGKITSPSIVERLLDSDIPGKISSIMTPSPITMDVADTVAKARDTMVKKRFDQLPVTKKGVLKGVIRADEIVFNLMPKTDRNMKGDNLAGRYGEELGMFTGDDYLTNEVTDSIRVVHENMSKSGSNYSVIATLGEIQGIVTYRDFLTVLAKKASKLVPMYMVGLPEDPFEAETARTKFQGAVQLLQRSTPDLEEARATIKTGQTKAPRKKYQVKVFVVYPRRHFSYEIFSYELADAFDHVNGWMKEIARAGSSRPRSGRTSNARSFPDDFRPETAPG